MNTQLQDFVVSMPTGEHAFEGCNVENTSFVELYFRRLILMNDTYHHDNRYVSLLKFCNLYNKITQNINSDWIRLLDDTNLSWKEQKSIAEHNFLYEFERYGIMYIAEYFGYQYSEYHNKIFPKNIDKNQLPFGIYLDDNDKPHVLGDTPYSIGAIKTAMLEQGETVFIQVITKGEIWHCFFSAAKGVRGEESGGKKHIHYISSKEGHSLMEIKEKILSNNYRFDKAHINNYSDEIPKYLLL